MSRTMPPLTAIRVFEAAARLGSFTKAGVELGMTQSAVSYQIRVLEERVGAPLFLRGGRQIAITDVGRQFGSACTNGLDVITTGFNQARGAARDVLTITLTSTFAANWLAHHLMGFQQQHPQLFVQLTNTEALIDLERDNIDVAIRVGYGDWPGLVSHKLIDGAFSPMMSPALLLRMGGLTGPEDLLRYPLIDPTDPWWNAWFAAAGVPRTGYEVDNGHKMGSQHLEAIAAIAWHGVAILTTFFYANELAKGRLVQPFDLTARSGSGYYLCYPVARRNVLKIRLFREWLLGCFFQGETARIAPAAGADEKRNRIPDTESSDL